jgi:hypothetical protein
VLALHLGAQRDRFSEIRFYLQWNDLTKRDPDYDKAIFTRTVLSKLKADADRHALAISRKSEFYFADGDRNPDYNPDYYQSKVFRTHRHHQLDPPEAPNVEPLTMEQIDKIVESSDLSKSNKRRLRDLLLRYKNVSEGKSDLKDVYADFMPEPSATPIHLPPYRYSEETLDGLKICLKQMWDEAKIRVSHSPWAFPVVMVPKANGKWRFCVDYRKLNKLLLRDNFPTMNLEDYFRQLNGSTLFTVFDLTSGYHQLPLSERSKKFTAFTTPFGHFEWNVLPMGILPASGMFQRAINALLGGLTWVKCLIYIDDIIIFSPNEEAHLADLQLILQRFQEVGLKVNFGKAQIAKTNVKYLGHIVTPDGTQPDPEKVKAIKEFPTPTSATEIRRFMGIVQFVAKYIPSLSKKAGPLHNLEKKNINFRWTAVEQAAFDSIRSSISDSIQTTYPLE